MQILLKIENLLCPSRWLSLDIYEIRSERISAKPTHTVRLEWKMSIHSPSQQLKRFSIFLQLVSFSLLACLPREMQIPSERASQPHSVELSDEIETENERVKVAMLEKNLNSLVPCARFHRD